MKLAWSGVVFSLGFFALVAQTLLFRVFLASFEGNELGIGCYFGSWLLWVAVGAVLGRALVRLIAGRPLLFIIPVLLYIPAYLLQHDLLMHARELAHVPSYEIFPLHDMVAVSLLANAAVSLLTGLLFTLACACAADSALPVARVYVLEALGGFVGGVAVTFMLALGVPAETVFLCATTELVIAVGALVVAGGKGAGLGKRVPVAACLVLASLLPFFLGSHRTWKESNLHETWTRLLPKDEYRGHFTTAQGIYLYGEREGQFSVLAWGGVCESLPNAADASEIMALNLAQHPKAKNVCIAGHGSLPVALRFCELPDVTKVTWFHPDPEYPKALWSVLPNRFRGSTGKLEIPAVDMRELLDGGKGQFDLVILNLPDVTTLVLNRYVTQEFFATLKRNLSPDGVVSVRLSGGENYLGGELAFLGASALKTLESVFPNVVLKPGEDSWLLASAGSGLTTFPAELRDRFAGIKGAAALYPPEALLSLYPPDRVAFQMKKYRAVIEDAAPEILVNTDRGPKALLYSLALALRRAGWKNVANDLPVLLRGSAWIVASAAVLYGLLRLLFMLLSSGTRTANARNVKAFDGGVLVLATGLAGMAMNVILMFFFQSRYGSLFLLVGLISSLFMLGLFLGGTVTERLLSKRDHEPRVLLPLALIAHLAAVLLVYALPLDASRFVYAGLFVLCGVFTGAYFPIAARRLHAAGQPPASAGARLEMIDHLGGAIGAILTGLFLLPLLGGNVSLGLLALLIGVNLVPILTPSREAQPQDTSDQFDRWTRPIGYGLAGIAVFALLASWITVQARAEGEGRKLQSVARELTGRDDLDQRTARLEDGTTLTYFALTGPDGQTTGHVFSTELLAPEIYGYGGPITLAVHVDRPGELQGYRIIRSRETPVYLRRLADWQKGLLKRNIFEAEAFEDVDAVSGATMTSDALTATLQRAGARFATEVLQISKATVSKPESPWIPSREFVWVSVLLLLAIGLRYVPEKWVRRSFLALSLMIAGFWLNIQYSTPHVFSLLGGEWPAEGLNTGFLLVLVVPVLVLLFGNIFCGYVCPFGALQELVGELRGKRIQSDPEKVVWRYGRAVKYLLLAYLAVLFALSRDSSILMSDPLVTFFSSLRDQWGFWLGVGAVALSLVFHRFWCRNLCPAGAFLALLNRVTLLRRIVPRNQPRRCDLGVRAHREMDCLCCDRCRFGVEGGEPQSEENGGCNT